MKSVSELWLSYRRECVPTDASPVQLRQTKRAFYAGAQALLHALVVPEPGSPAPTWESTFSGVRMLNDELGEFGKSIGQDELE